jgi:hypothetical protein
MPCCHTHARVHRATCGCCGWCAAGESERRPAAQCTVGAAAMRQTLGTAARAQSSSGCGSSHHAACSCHLRGGSVAGARPQPNRGWRVVGAVSHASHCEGPGRESHANKIHSGPRKVRQKGARQQFRRTPQCTTMSKNINSQLGLISKRALVAARDVHCVELRSCTCAATAQRAWRRAVQQVTTAHDPPCGHRVLSGSAARSAAAGR